jgi:hypothetical protein
MMLVPPAAAIGSGEEKCRGVQEKKTHRDTFKPHGSRKLTGKLAARALRALWGAACSAPLLAVFHETVIGVVPGPIANTQHQGALVWRPAAPSRGAAVVFENPLAPGRHASGRVAAVPGERALLSGQLWVAAGAGGPAPRVDSEAFGPLPAALVAGAPLLFFPSPCAPE